MSFRIALAVILPLVYKESIWYADRGFRGLEKEESEERKESTLIEKEVGPSPNLFQISVFSTFRGFSIILHFFQIKGGLKCLESVKPFVV